jgi:hypothetical protein
MVLLNIFFAFLSIFLATWVIPPYIRSGEQVTLKGTLNTYTINSGSGGIFGHTHAVNLYNSELPQQYKHDYDVLFTCDIDLSHAHPDVNTVYGIKNNEIYTVGRIGEDKTFTLSNTKTNVLEKAAFHSHPINITNTTPNV